MCCCFNLVTTYFISSRLLLMITKQPTHLSPQVTDLLFAPDSLTSSVNVPDHVTSGRGGFLGRKNGCLYEFISALCFRKTKAYQLREAAKILTKVRPISHNTGTICEFLRHFSHSRCLTGICSCHRTSPQPSFSYFSAGMWSISRRQPTTQSLTRMASKSQAMRY